MVVEGARRIDGFDLSHDAVRAARRAGADARLSFCVADATRLPVAAQSYDAVVSFETIEHTADERGFLAEAVRVLRPGGHLLFSTPNRRLLDPGTNISDSPFNPFHVREIDVSGRAGVQGSGSGFRVQGSGFGVQGSGFRVRGSGFRVQGSGEQGENPTASVLRVPASPRLPSRT